MFSSVCTEIFGTILLRFAADQEKANEPDVSEKIDGNLETMGKPLEFDYESIAQLLNDAAGHEGVAKKRQKRIEKLAKR